MKEFPKRKSPRLKGYDYSKPGAYFITICTYNMKYLFSNIAWNDLCESCEYKLTDYGTYVESIIGKLPDRFNVSISKYVIMPNHIHMIVEIENEDGEWAIHESPVRYRSIIDKMIGYLKMNVSKKMHETYSDKIWHRSYHDHIIRGEKDYQKIWEYIDTNVLRWEKDCFYNNV